MTLMETNSTTDQIYENVWGELAKRYNVIEKKNRKVFYYSENRFFAPCLFRDPYNAIVIEYNGEDEGDLFYLEDYDSIDALMKDILQEIENL